MPHHCGGLLLVSAVPTMPSLVVNGSSQGYYSYILSATTKHAEAVIGTAQQVPGRTAVGPIASCHLGLPFNSSNVYLSEADVRR